MKINPYPLWLFNLKTYVFVSFFFVLSFKSLAYEKQVHQKDPIQFNESIYKKLIETNNNELLWFSGSRLSLDGRELYSLLDDLGVFGDSFQLLNLKQNKLLWDYYLAQGIFSLMQLASPKTNIQEHFNQLSIALSKKEVEELLISITPQFDQVSLLRKEIAKYKRFQNYEWPKLDSAFRPKLGQNHKAVRDIRNVLTILGYLPAKEQKLSRLGVFDTVAITAIKKFQKAHGLMVDGKLGPQTYSVLNLSPKHKLEKLQLNLQRWFTLPKDLPEQYLIVNIPSYKLHLFDKGLKKLDMKVIVGTKKDQTPEMVTHINRLTINPTWTPTFNIVKNELYPEYKHDYLTLKRRNFQLVKGYRDKAIKKEIEEPNLNLIKLMRTYRLVQAPGDNNALGIYRFNIPNTYSVYLHDTPQKSLFNKHNRAFSHGCIRLEEADKLASYLINNNYNLSQKVQAALGNGKTTHFPLNESLPVYIIYQTAWINDSGTLQIFPDIYDKDQEPAIIAQFDAIDSNPVITVSNNYF